MSLASLSSKNWPFSLQGLAAVAHVNEWSHRHIEPFAEPPLYCNMTEACVNGAPRVEPGNGEPLTSETDACLGGIAVALAQEQSNSEALRLGVWWGRRNGCQAEATAIS